MVVIVFYLLTKKSMAVNNRCQHPNNNDGFLGCFSSCRISASFFFDLFAEKGFYSKKFIRNIHIVQCSWKKLTEFQTTMKAKYHSLLICTLTLMKIVFLF